MYQEPCVFYDKLLLLQKVARRQRAPHVVRFERMKELMQKIKEATIQPTVALGSFGIGWPAVIFLHPLDPRSKGLPKNETIWYEKGWGSKLGGSASTTSSDKNGTIVPFSALQI